MGKITFAWALLAVAASGAQAAVTVSAFSASQTQAGQQPSTSAAEVVNGVLTGNNFTGANGFSNAGPIGPGALSAFANTNQPDGGLRTTASANADLSTGMLRNMVEAPGGLGIGSSTGVANSRWVETVTFNNVGGQTVELGISWLTEGVVTDTSGPSWGSQTIYSGIFIANVNNPNYSVIRFKDDDPVTPGALSSGAQFNFGTFGGPGAPYFTFAPAGNNQEGIWNTTLLNQTSGAVAATLLVPTGLSSITIDAQLNLDCRSGALCDFGNTASFSFGTMPDGLTWTSESGVFLTAAIPEPATYGLFALGLGLVALARRRR